MVGGEEAISYLTTKRLSPVVQCRIDLGIVHQSPTLPEHHGLLRVRAVFSFRPPDNSLADEPFKVRHQRLVVIPDIHRKDAIVIVLHSGFLLLVVMDDGPLIAFDDIGSRLFS